jgi:protein-S-isoprenylcysteine O-methyltransferase Ste14
MTGVLFNQISIGWALIAIALFPILLKIKQPYGRHTNKTWGFLIPNKIGWFIMEVPSPLLFSIVFLSGNKLNNPVSVVIFSFWMIHYIHRTFIFPFKLHTKGKKIPILIVIMGFSFNLVNASLNAYFLGYISDGYSCFWFVSPQFILGTLLFFTGMVINIQADYQLIALRKSSSNGYRIPRGGLFKYVSCPNHFGEIVEWIGFAVLSWNFASLSFAIWTIVNIVPRSLDHQKWYKAKFSHYPKKRKAVFPFVL